MKLLFVWAVLSLAAPFLPNVAHASLTHAATAEAAQTADIPFDPPLDAPLRFRWEKSVKRDGKTRMSWAVSEFRFEQRGQGFRLIVTPVSAGSSEQDPERLALEKRLEKLINHPFVLHLDASGSIEQLEGSDRYWATIFTVLRSELTRPGTKPDFPAFDEALESVLGMYEKMPAEARLALLTESIQPALEFGDTRTESGKPIVTVIEVVSPFGGTLKRNVAISLAKVVDQHAYLTVQSTVPRSELDALAKNMMAMLVKLPAEQQAEMKRGMASLESFRHETDARYQVSIEDGMLSKFLSTETIEVSDKGKKTLRITTRSLDRVN